MSPRSTTTKPKRAATATNERKRKITKRKSADAKVAAEQRVADEPRPKGRSLAEWQAEFERVVGRSSESSSIPYLRWKVARARAGKVPVGPLASTAGKRARRARAEGEAMTIPLPLPAPAVDAMDATWRAAGYASRAAFIRRALRSALRRHSAPEAAALLPRGGCPARGHQSPDAPTE